MKYRAFRKLLARLLALCLLLSGLPALAEDDAIDVGDVSVEDDFAVAVDVQKNETEVNVPDKEPQSSEASDVTVNAGSVTNTTETTTSPKDDKAVFGVVVDNATDDKNVTVNAGNVNVSATIMVDEQAEDDDGGDDKNDGGDDKNDGDDNNDGDNKNDGGDNNDAGNDDKNDGDGDDDGDDDGDEDGDDDGDDDGDEDGDDDDDDGDDDEYRGPKSEVYGVNVNAWTEWQDSLSEPGQNSNLTSAHVNGDVNVTGEADRPGKAAGISGGAHGNDVEISVSGDVSATGKGGMSAVGIDGYSETGIYYNDAPDGESEHANHEQRRPGDAKLSVEGNVKAESEHEDATAVNATGEGGSLEVNVGGNATAISTIGDATGVQASANMGGKTMDREGEEDSYKESSTNVPGEVKVSVAGDVNAQGKAFTKGASSDVEGSSAEMNLGGNVSAVSSEEEAEGVHVWASTGRTSSKSEGQSDPRKETEQSEFEGSEANVTVKGDVKAQGKTGAVGVNATGDGSSVNVVIEGGITAVTDEYWAEALIANAYTGGTAVNREEGSGYNKESSECEPGEVNAAVKGDVKAEGQSAGGISVEANGGTGNVSVDGSVTATATEYSAYGASVYSNMGRVLTEYESTDDPERETYHNENEAGNAEVVIKGNVKAEAEGDAQGASVNTDGGNARLSIDGDVTAVSETAVATGAFVGAGSATCAFTRTESWDDENDEYVTDNYSREKNPGKTILAIGGSVSASARHEEATGLDVYLTGGSAEATVGGGVTATSAEGRATGILVGGENDETLDPKANTANVTVKSAVKAESKRDAAGVRAYGDERDAVVTIGGSVEAVSSDRGAAGVLGESQKGSSTIVVKGSVSATSLKDKAEATTYEGESEDDRKNDASAIRAVADGGKAVTNITVEGDASAKGGYYTQGMRIRAFTGGYWVNEKGEKIEDYDDEPEGAKWVEDDKGGTVNVTVKGNVTAEGEGEVSAIQVMASNNSAVKATVGGDAIAKGKDSFGAHVEGYKGSTTDVVVGGTLAGGAAAIKVARARLLDYPTDSGREDCWEEIDPETVNFYVWKAEQNEKGEIAQVFDEKFEMVKVEDKWIEPEWNEETGEYENVEHTDTHYEYGPFSETVNEEASRALEARIWYIAKVQDAFASIISAKGTNTYEQDDTTYQLAHQDENVTVNVALGEDEVLEGIQYNETDTAEYTVNADGSYAVKMLRGGAMLLGAKIHKHTRAAAVKEIIVAPSCTADGHHDEVVYCSECKKELSRATVTDKATGHSAGSAVTENSVAATCAKAGSYDEVVYCTVCKAELSRTPRTVEKPAHTPAEAVKENVVAATCAKEGSYDEVVYCSKCNAELSRAPRTVEKLAHTPAEAVQENVVDATCTKEGSCDEVVYCSKCNAELSRAAKVIEKLAHTPAEAVQENAVAATCAKEGSCDEVVYCSKCNAELSRTVKVVAGKLPHAPGKPVKENVVAATTTSGGSYDEVVYCGLCGEELSREKRTTPKLDGPVEPMPTLQVELVYEPVSDDTEVNGVKVSDALPVAQALEKIGQALEAEKVKVSIPGVEKVLSANEKDRFDKLPVKDQLAVALNILGLGDALDVSAVDMSEEAAALSQDISARLDEMPEAEKQALLNEIAAQFPKKQITVDGKLCDAFSIDVVTERDGKKTYTRYTFYNDDSQWVLYRIEQGLYREVEA